MSETAVASFIRNPLPSALAGWAVLGQAHDWGQHWAADVRAIRNGHAALGWHDIERGVLLKGAHGVGKTSFVRALAGQAELTVIDLTLPAADTDAEQARQQLEARWEDAKRAAPSLLFLQAPPGDLEGLAFLWDGFDPAAPVVVFIAQPSGSACASLLRPGRIERVFDIVPPSLEALQAFAAPLLLAAGCRLDPANQTEFLRNAREHLGALAELALVIRQAQLDARRENQPPALRHLMHALYGSGETTPRRLAPEAAEAIAFHEAGHAALMLLGTRGRQELSYLSIAPIGEQLGVTRLCFDESRPSETRQELLERLQSDLGGRAAEEIRYGTLGISTGSSSDLEQATQIALQMCTRYGFGTRGALVSWEGDLARHDALREEVESLLAVQYDIALQSLRQYWTFVTRLAMTLVARTALTGEEARRMFDEYLQERESAEGTQRFRCVG